MPVIGWAVFGFVTLALLGCWLGWLATRTHDESQGGDPVRERTSRSEDPR